MESIPSLDLDGIEVYHPDHSKKQTQYYLEYTQKHNLLVSGGSDFHDWDNKKISWFIWNWCRLFK